MSAQTLINTLADTARAAGRTLSTATGAERKAALQTIADAIEARSVEILAANAKDMEAGHAAGLNSSLLDRLLLTPERIQGIAGGARQVSELPDPLGITLRQSHCLMESSWNKSQFHLVLLEWSMKHVLM